MASQPTKPELIPANLGFSLVVKAVLIAQPKASAGTYTVHG